MKTSVANLCKVSKTQIPSSERPKRFPDISNTKLRQNKLKNKLFKLKPI